MYAHRGPPGMSPRYLELLEMLKSEYESMYHEVSMNKIHREDAESKFHAQLVDLGVIQKALYELERAHMKMKQHYEDEIARLKHELEERGGPTFTHGTSAAALIQFPSPPALEAELASFAATFASLPASSAMEQAGITSGGAPYGGKRGPDDDAGNNAALGRNVRPRDEAMLMTNRPHSTGMLTMQQQQQPRGMDPQYIHHPFSPHGHHQPPPQSMPLPPQNQQPQATGHTKKYLPPPLHAAPGGGNMATGQIPLPPAATETTGGAGFDWLVVYNPKAARSIGIDLLHTVSHDNVVCCVRFSLDGKYLATGSNRVVTILDVKSGERFASLSDTKGVAQDVDQYVRSVSFSPDGRFLATGSEDQIVRIWDITSQKVRHRLTGHSQDIYSVEYFPDGKRIVSGSGDRTLCIWDAESGDLIKSLPVENVENGREAGITSVAVSPNGKYVVAGCLDRTIRVWEAESGKPLDTLEGHRDSVYSVSFSPDGRHLISGSLDKTIKVWQFDSAENIYRGACKYTILGHKDFVLSVTGTPPDGRWIVSGSKDRSVQFWDSLSGTTQLMLQGHKNSVISVAISPSGNCFATGSGDCRARIWSYTKVTPTNGGGSGTHASASSLSGSLNTTNGGESSASIIGISGHGVSTTSSNGVSGRPGNASPPSSNVSSSSSSSTTPSSPQ